MLESAQTLPAVGRTETLAEPWWTRFEYGAAAAADFTILVIVMSSDIFGL
jgi:hypothetical protein